MPMFIIRTFKAFGAREAEERWVNNYEVETGLALGAIDPVVNAIVDAEKALHYAGVQFISATISTWEADSKPYNPLTFRTMELVGTGARAAPAVGTYLSADACLMVRFETATGRSGRRFYRGCLAEVDVEGAANLRWLAAANGAVGNGGAAMTAFATAIAPVLGQGAAGGTLVLASTTGGPVVQRAVTGVKYGSIVVNKRNHKYFDRA